MELRTNVDHFEKVNLSLNSSFKYLTFVELSLVKSDKNHVYPPQAKVSLKEKRCTLPSSLKTLILYFLPFDLNDIGETMAAAYPSLKELRLHHMCISTEITSALDKLIEDCLSVDYVIRRDNMGFSDDEDVVSSESKKNSGILNEIGKLNRDKNYNGDLINLYSESFFESFSNLELLSLGCIKSKEFIFPTSLRILHIECKNYATRRQMYSASNFEKLNAISTSNLVKCNCHKLEKPFIHFYLWQHFVFPS